MIKRPMIHDKIGDLLILEGRAFELYKGALGFPESAKYKDAINKIMNDELKHIKLVRKILELLVQTNL